VLFSQLNDYGKRKLAETVVSSEIVDELVPLIYSWSSPSSSTCSGSPPPLDSALSNMAVTSGGIEQVFESCESTPKRPRKHKQYCISQRTKSESDICHK
jgi:hypothetical protein